MLDFGKKPRLEQASVIFHQALDVKRTRRRIDRGINAPDFSAKGAVRKSFHGQVDRLADTHPRGHLLRHFQSRAHGIDIHDPKCRSRRCRCLQVLPHGNVALLDEPVKRRADAGVAKFFSCQVKRCLVLLNRSLHVGHILQRQIVSRFRRIVIGFVFIVRLLRHDPLLCEFGTAPELLLGIGQIRRRLFYRRRLRRISELLLAVGESKFGPRLIEECLRLRNSEFILERENLHQDLAFGHVISNVYQHLFGSPIDLWTDRDFVKRE